MEYASQNNPYISTYVLESMSKKLKRLSEIRINARIVALQKTAIVYSARILRNVLDV